MYARFFEMTIRPEKKSELFQKVRDEILPILRKSKDFFDLLALEVEAEPTKLYAILFWSEKLDAEKFEGGNFVTITTILGPFLTMPIIVKLCKVDETMSRKITVTA